MVDKSRTLSPGRALRPEVRMNKEQEEAVRKPFVCTPGNPWRKGADPTPAQHPDAVCVYDGGWEQEYERYECPHCKERFTVEIPQ